MQNNLLLVISNRMISNFYTDMLAPGMYAPREGILLTVVSLDPSEVVYRQESFLVCHVH